MDLATEVIIGKTIRELGYEPGLQPEAEYFAIKMPVFSFEKIRGAEISLGPEMKSTGECLGIAKTFNEALYKAFLGAGVELPKYKNMIITVKDADKGEAIEVGRRFEKLGYTIYATRSTAAALNEAGVKARKVNKISQESPDRYGPDPGTQDRPCHRYPDPGPRQDQRRFPDPPYRYRDRYLLHHCNGHRQCSRDQHGAYERL